MKHLIKRQIEGESSLSLPFHSPVATSARTRPTQSQEPHPGFSRVPRAQALGPSSRKPDQQSSWHSDVPPEASDKALQSSSLTYSATTPATVILGWHPPPLAHAEGTALPSGMKGRLLLYSRPQCCASPGSSSFPTAHSVAQLRPSPPLALGATSLPW